MSGMSLNMSPKLEMSQKMLLAPKMIQSMEILQLPILDLQARIQQELQENPMLEMRDDEGDADSPELAAPDTVPNDDGPDPDGPLVSDDDNALDFNRLDALSRDYEDAFNEEHRPSRNGLDDQIDRKHDAMQNMPSRPQSLQDYLNEQLTFIELTPIQEQLVRYLISHIDESGKLTVVLTDVERDFTPPVTLDEVEEALEVVQKLDPPGVGFRDLKECLLLQIGPDMPLADVLRCLILHHLDDIRHNRLPQIHKRTGYSVSDITEAIEQLKRLDPKPGARFVAVNTQYVTADIIVERAEDGEYDVRLADDWMPRLHISRNYLDMTRNKGVDPKTRDYLKRKLMAASWLREAIEQRRGTLERVTRAIIQHQRDFLERGPDHIVPLKMQQIAEQVGVHVTTVSRAVDDKWVQTPRGLFPLKRFFGGGTQTLDGQEVAWETIKQKLLELIDNEDKSNPLSDEDLVTKLQEANFPVARRTVTKYRKMLKIPSSRQRKDWTLSPTS